MCLLVVLSFTSFPVLRSASGYYSLWVALANFMKNAAVIMAGPSGSTQCAVSAFGRTYAQFASFAVSVIIAVRVYMLFHNTATSPLQDALNRLCSSLGLTLPSWVYLGDDAAGSKKAANLRVSLGDVFFVWMAPIPVAAIPFYFGNYFGKSSGQLVCWITTDGLKVPGMTFFYNVPLWSTIAYTVYMYVCIYLTARAQLQVVEAEAEAGRRMRSLVKKLVWYPFNLVLCTSLYSTIIIMAYSGVPLPLPLLLANEFLINSLALVDSVAYFLTPIVFQCWTGYFRHRAGCRHLCDWAKGRPGPRLSDWPERKSEIALSCVGAGAGADVGVDSGGSVRASVWELTESGEEAEAELERESQALLQSGSVSVSVSGSAPVANPLGANAVDTRTCEL